jgi:hypothetical protein
MIAVVAAGREQAVVDVLAREGETAVPLGTLVAADGSGARVTYEGRLDLAW